MFSCLATWSAPTMHRRESLACLLGTAAATASAQTRAR